METQVAKTTVPARPRATRTPQVDIFENDHEIQLLADVPGAQSESVKLEVEQGMLRFVAGTAENTWSRSFIVPRGIAVDAINAQLSSGVLKIVLPKSAETRRRTVEVRPG